MARINELGTITARCPGCNGAFSSFEWLVQSKPYGSVRQVVEGHGSSRDRVYDYRLFRCAGCGRGGIGVTSSYNNDYPAYAKLESFYPECAESLALPKAVPDGIAREFREAERCMDAQCFRAAAGLFRSVLDKTLRANGCKVARGTSLAQQIDMAAKDGAITAARQRRAHEDIRALGNDVLHEDWVEINLEDVAVAQKYAQRILEDLYDDRETVLETLRAAGRVPLEDATTETSQAQPAR
ncbi:DUF4145 domain-containing protein [Lysobacter sp. FW306-1B-D06B]|uniref:DUF4145 domain-containing protein n=1 Tax=Lysobacter sp. FW306-1B-D06B TaxID=3140250 RepID=UPI003140BC35